MTNSTTELNGRLRLSNQQSTGPGHEQQKVEVNEERKLERSRLRCLTLKKHWH